MRDQKRGRDWEFFYVCAIALFAIVLAVAPIALAALGCVSNQQNAINFSFYGPGGETWYAGGAR